MDLEPKIRIRFPLPPAYSQNKETALSSVLGTFEIEIRKEEILTMRSRDYCLYLILPLYHETG